RACVVHVDLAGPKIRTCGIGEPLSLAAGDRLIVHAGDQALPPLEGVPRVGCTLPRALRAVRPGHRVWFDDGTIGGVAERVLDEGILVLIDHARGGHRRLGANRGINLPESTIDVSGFTAKDREDVRVVAPLADTVALSFVQR